MSTDRTKCTRTEIGQYNVHETVGEGSFGEVKRVTHKKTQKEYAIKIMSLERIKLNNLSEQVKREISILRQLDHPNIVKLIEVLKDKRFMFLITELIDGGDLFDRLVAKKIFTESEARSIFAQIVDGVCYCHARGVCHRDLKIENILLTKDLQVRIADFGFSNAFWSGDVEEEKQMKTLCGTPSYIPAEILKHEKYYGTKVDVYCLGVILYFMISGVLPFDQENNDDLFAAIIAGDYTIPDYFSDSLKTLIRGMINKNTNERFTMMQVQKHEWMTTSNLSSTVQTDNIPAEEDFFTKDTFVINRR